MLRIVDVVGVLIVGVSFASQARAACASTVGINPLPIHSHNDYTRNVPLCDALASAASSIEADVWLTNGVLNVAYTQADINPSITLDSLYVQPLLALLNAQNPGGVKAGVRPNGIFQSSPTTTLQFLIDFKSDGPSTFAPVVAALAPLAAAGYLTTFNTSTSTLIPSAITVVGTGNTPFGLVQSMSPRTLFFDAPLDQLAAHPEYSGPSLAALASADFGATIGWPGIVPISSSQRATVKSWFATAHARGIKARFYNTPDFVTAVMEQVWEELLDDGEDWLNVDHLTTAENFYINWKKTH